MNIRKARWIILGITGVLLALALVLHVSGRITFLGLTDGKYACNAPLSALMMDRDAYEEIQNTRKKASVQNMPPMLVDGYEAAYDAQTRTFYASLNENTKLETYNPRITLEMPANLAVQVCFKEMELTDQDVEDNWGYSFMIYNDQYWVECSLNYSTLPQLRITTNETPEDPENPIGQEDTWVILSLYDNREKITRRVTESQALMRIRGLTSATFPQNSYRISLKTESVGGSTRNNNLSLLGMRADDDWILTTTFNDPDKLRAAFSWRVWNAMDQNALNLSTGTEAVLTEVFINNRYWGLYTLMYPVQEETLGLEEGDSLYRCDGWVSITGELLENPELLSEAGFRVLFPETGETDWTPLADYLSLMGEENEEMLRRVQEICDLDNLIDMAIFLQVACAQDNTQKNIDWIALKDGPILLAPWDLDLTWGNEYMDNIRSFSTFNPASAASVISYQDPVLNRLVFGGNQAFLEKLAERYQELRQSVLSEENLLGLLKELGAQVYESGAYLRTSDRWPQAAYSDDIFSMRDWIVQRLQTVDGLISSLTGVTMP